MKTAKRKLRNAFMDYSKFENQKTIKTYNTKIVFSLNTWKPLTYINFNNLTC